MKVLAAWCDRQMWERPRAVALVSLLPDVQGHRNQPLIDEAIEL
jgi:hypothetical protein